MDKVAQIVFENIASGKIDKAIGVEILKTLKLEESKQIKQDIAIIGMSLRLPKADDVDTFWDNLKNARDCITDFPEGRQNDALDLVQYTYVKDRSKVEFCQGGYFEEVDKFDYKFFGLSPKEASLMDPNQRMFLETAWKAIEDAGYGGNKLNGSSTGLYIGYSGWPMYGQFVSNAEPESLMLSVLGNISAIIAGRLSNFLNLRGPSMLIDSACSSSLTALHTACRALMNGDCGQAIVGGIRTLLMPVEGMISYGIESKNQRAKPFDEDADGTPLSEGMTAVLIKPLSKAIKDGDNIHAVIKGSAVNQDGYTPGFVTPNVQSQIEVLTNAWNDAGIDPTTISYIEAHGIGTKIGDPIEVEGITKAFKKYTDKKQFCALGTLKSNIGHTDSCAGLAAVIKAVLSLKNRQLAPSVHFKTPNKDINFEQSPVFVNKELKNWEADIRRCGISCFGFGGTNCHVVLEEYNGTTDADKTQEKAADIFTLSAKSPEALKQIAARYQELVSNGLPVPAGDICYTVNTGRGHFNARLAFVIKDAEELQEKLMNLDIEELKSDPQSGVYYNYSKKFAGEAVKELRSASVKKVEEILNAGSSSKALLEELCEMYIAGADINWEKLYINEKHSKVSLPAYQFEKTRCWINVPQSQSTEEVAGSMLENILSEDINFEF